MEIVKNMKVMKRNNNCSNYNVLTQTRLCFAIDNMLWTMYAYRSTPPTETELAEYDRTYKPYIHKLMEEVKNDPK